MLHQEDQKARIKIMEDAKRMEDEFKKRMTRKDNKMKEQDIDDAVSKLLTSHKIGCCFDG